MESMLRVGQILYGYCGGYFGRDAYESKRIEAIGADWVVAREIDGDHYVYLYRGNPEDLLEYTSRPKEDENY